MEYHWHRNMETQSEGQTNLEIAAEAISLQISLFVLVKFDLVLFSHGVPHHNAALWHQLSKLLRADVRRQAWGQVTRWEWGRINRVTAYYWTMTKHFFCNTNLTHRRLCFYFRRYRTILQRQKKILWKHLLNIITTVDLEEIQLFNLFSLVADVS